VRHSPRAFPWERLPPVGGRQDTGRRGRSARVRRPRVRVCLRKGCGRKYQARCWNQRYCQDPECLRLVRRWQAARRQAERRQDSQVKARHAQAESARRQRAKSTSQTVDDPAVTPARGHAADHAPEIFFPLRCAIGRAATRIPRARRTTPHVTVLSPAGRPCAMSTTANASGCAATPTRAA
jgi:hypothetical protein